MDLSIAEAAQYLGRSERQIRYRIQQGELRAAKQHGQWRIRAEDLPLSEGQVAAGLHKGQRASALAPEVPMPRGGRKGKLCLREVHALRIGAQLLQELRSLTASEHRALPLLEEALMLVSCGFFEFAAGQKAAFYGRAREQASRAITLLLLDADPSRDPVIERFENELLPAIGGLIRQAERWGRK